MTDRKKKTTERWRQAFSSFQESLGREVTQGEFAEFIGLHGGQPRISKIMNGSATPDAEEALLLAARMGGDPIFYQGLEPIHSDAGRPPQFRVEYGGDVQAGVWHEANDFGEGEPLPIIWMLNVPHYNDMRYYRVRGLSMNKIYSDNDVVVVASVFTNPLLPRHEDIVLVQRRNKRGLYEATLKELQIDTVGRKWLWPRSTAPEFQAPLDLSGSESDVQITGVVVLDFRMPRRRHGANDDVQTREQEILDRKNRGQSNAKIGADLGISRERVRQILDGMGVEGPRK